MTTTENRNALGLKPGDRVCVTNPAHRDFQKVGTIIKLDGIADDQHGNARAHIRCPIGAYIHVSLGNLEKF